MAKETGKGPGGHPTVARSAEIDSAIIIAALTIFSQQGSDFSMDEVAGMAGVSKQAIYRRFDSKLLLLQAAIDAGSAMLVGDATDNLPEDPVDALYTAALRLFDRGGPGSIGATVHLEAAAIRSTDLRASLLKSRRALDAAIDARLGDVAAAGRLAEGARDVQTQVLLDLLLGANIRLNTAEMFGEEDRARVFDERWSVCKALLIRPATRPQA